MSGSEAQLLERARLGDQVALGQLLERHQQRLYNVALRMVGNRDDAAEVAQDALLRVVEHIDDYNGESALTTWMVRITMNLAISHLRKRKVRQAASLDVGGEDDDQTTALRRQLADEREPGPVSNVETSEMLGHLHRALAGLDEEFRAVLVLRDIDQMDYQQIAVVLSVPVGTVKSRLFRARLALRQEMARLVPSLGSPAERRPS